MRRFVGLARAPVDGSAAHANDGGTAIDSDDVQRATSLMKRAKIDPATIAMVVRKMQDGDTEH
jgi:hypothetical protein